jgi:hypothetical protein
MPTLIESGAAQMRGIGGSSTCGFQKLCVAASGYYAQQVVARTLHSPAPIKMRSPAERVLTSGDIFDGYIREDKRLSRARH